MATKKRQSVSYVIQHFANTYSGKVTKFQGNGLFCIGVLSHLLGWRWKTPLVLIRLILFTALRFFLKSFKQNRGFVNSAYVVGGWGSSLSFCPLGLRGGTRGPY